MRIPYPGLFDPGSGMENFGSGIRDKHPGSATLLNTVDHFYVQISRCEQLPLLIKVWEAVGVAWGLSSCWCGLTRDLSSCLSSLRSEQLTLWFEARTTAGMVFEIWDAGMVWCLSSCRFRLRSEQLPLLFKGGLSRLSVWFDFWAAACIVWGLSSCRYGLRPVWAAAGMGWDLWAVDMVWGQSSCRYGIRSGQLPIRLETWAAASEVWGLRSCRNAVHLSSCLYGLTS